MPWMNLLTEYYKPVSMFLECTNYLVFHSSFLGAGVMSTIELKCKLFFAKH